MINLNKAALFLLMGLCASFPLAAQQLDSESCLLTKYQSGDHITVSGTVNGTPHGLFLHVAGCSNAIVVAFPSQLQESEKQGLDPVKKDENTESLRADLRATSTKQVKAILTGRLDIAKPVPEGGRTQLGVVYDASGKKIGPYGFGNPTPVYKYRFVLEQVASKEVNPER